MKKIKLSDVPKRRIPAEEFAEGVGATLVAKVGDIFDIMITGMVGRYKGKVVKEGKWPTLQVVNEDGTPNPHWQRPLLKSGDYILMARQANE